MATTFNYDVTIKYTNGFGGQFKLEWTLQENKYMTFEQVAEMAKARFEKLADANHKKQMLVRFKMLDMEVSYFSTKWNKKYSKKF